MRETDGKPRACESAKGRSDSRTLRTLCFLVLTISIAQIKGYPAITQNSPLPDARIQIESPTERLVPGKTTEGEITGENVHIYQIALDSGQFLRVTVQQRGIDLLVRLLAPDAHLLTELDTPNGSQGTEQVVIVAEMTGIHRLELRPLSRSSQPGKYEVRIEELRSATAQDRKRASAEISLARAARLEGTQPLAMSSKQAIATYEAVLPVMQETGNRRGEALTLVGLGRAYQLLNETQNALKYYDRALPILQDLGDRPTEAGVRGNMGGAYDRLGNKQSALESFGIALQLDRAVGDRGEEAINLLNMAIAYDSIGEVNRALEYYAEGRSVAAGIGNPQMEAAALTGIGLIRSSLGQRQKALDCYFQALPILQAEGESRALSTLLNNIGLVYDSLGDSATALGYYDNALRLRKLGEDQHGEAITLINIGAAHKSAGRLQQALDSYEAALKILRRIGDKRFEAATLSNIGMVHQSLGKNEKALEYYNLSLELAKAVGNRRSQAITLKNIGSVYSFARETLTALYYLGQSLALSRGMKDLRTEAAALYFMARTKRDCGQLVAARADIEAALEIVESLRLDVINSELRTSYLASVQPYYELYIDALMRLHRVYPKQGYDALALEASERARARTLLETLAETSIDIHKGVNADLLEQERALRQLIDAKTERLTRNANVASVQSEQMKKEVDGLLAQYHEVRARIRADSPQYAALTQLSPISVKQIQQELPHGDTLLLEYALGEERSYLWAVTNDSFMSFSLPSRVRVEDLTKRFFGLLSAGTVRHSGEPKQGTSRGSEAEYSKTAAQLSQLLLGPVALPGKQRLLIVADGALNYLPFAALPLPDERQQSGARGVSAKAGQTRTLAHRGDLITEHEVINVPSASVLAAVRQEKARQGTRPEPAGSVAVFADPVFGTNDDRAHQKPEPRVNDGAAKAAEQPHVNRLNPMPPVRSAEGAGFERGQGFARLPFSGREAAAINAIAGGSKAMMALGFDANKPRALNDELKRFRIIHFATHGLLDGEHPELSGLVLSLVDDRGNPQDGFLRLIDIYNMDLSADLVVLSGCQTALGKQMDGEGLIGLTRGFLYAGSSRVIASLWRVDDEATAELMTRFYEGVLMRRERPAAALRAAQIWMRRQKLWKPPYYWAGFTLQGEWK